MARDRPVESQETGPTNHAEAPEPLRAEIRVEQQVGAVAPDGRVTGVEVHYAEQVVVQAGEAAAPPEPGDPPYRGLDLYDVGDAPLFFGRERLTAELVGFLREHSFLAVIGASGSGKSSLVRAGMAAALRAGQALEGGVLPPLGSTEWPQIMLTPTATPLERLARALAGDGVEARKLMDDMRQNAGALRDFLAEGSGASGERSLLVVDQFEELFTLCQDRQEREAYVDNLLAAAGMMPAVAGVATVILTLRSDFYTSCGDLPNLRAALETQQRYIGAMSRDELQRTVEMPAQRGRWALQLGLAEEILEEVGDEPGKLPLLSHALLETWRRRNGRVMTLAGYRDAGKVQGAIARTAQRVYDDLSPCDPDEKEIARSIFLSLVHPGEAGRSTRRREALSTLAPAVESPERKVLLKLSSPEARLVTVDEDSVQISHEALIWEWPQLGEWLQAHDRDLRLLEGIRGSAQAWAGAPEEEKESLLVHRGGRLDDAVDLMQTGRLPLREGERHYLRACVELRDRQIQAERQRQEERVLAAEQLAAKEREARQKEQQARRRTVIAVIGVALFVVAAALAVWFFISSGTERRLRGEAEFAKGEVERLSRAIRADQLTANALTAADKDRPLALLLAVEGLRVQHDITHTEVISGISTVVHEAVAGSAQTHMHELLGQAGSLTLTGHKGDVTAVAFSHDGRWLATASEDTTVRLWKVDDPRAEPTVLWGNKATVTAVAFSPDSRWLATGSGDGTARLWKTDDPGGEPVLSLEHADLVTAVDFSPDSRLLATTSGDGTAHLWQVENPTADPVVFWSGNESFTAVAFSPDGRVLATASEDSGVRLWKAGLWPTKDPATYTPLAQFWGSGWATAVAFSPDGQWLADGGSGGTVHLWQNSESADRRVELRGHAGYITAVAFSPDSRWLATAAEDSTVRLWQVQDPGAAPAVLEGHSGWVNGVAFSPDGRWLATASGDDTARLWTWRVQDLIELACREAGRNLSLEEWQRFFPGMRYRPSCDEWPIHLSVLKACGGYVQPSCDAAGAFDRYRQCLAGFVDKDVEVNREISRTLATDLVACVRNATLYVDIEQRTAALQAAVKYDPTLDIQPEPEAKRLTAAQLADWGEFQAESGNLDEAITTFRQAVAYDPALGIDPEAEARRLAAPDLILEGRELALADGDANGAIAKFELALEYDPSLDLDPEAEVAQLLRYRWLQEGCRLAGEGDLSGAVTEFRQQLADHPALKIDPEAEARRCAANSVRYEAASLARRGDVEGAIAMFEQALVYSPTLDVDPEVDAYVAAAMGLANSGAFTEAMDMFAELESMRPGLDITATLYSCTWNRICWDGSLAGAASAVLPACNRALALAVVEADIYWSPRCHPDSRGLARALTGDFAGAIADFESSVRQWKGEYDDPALRESRRQHADWWLTPDLVTSTEEELLSAVELRQSWIADLQRGKNPFDAATLDALREE